VSINSARFNSIFQGITAIAQRVYQAVPISEAWNYQAIHGELVRTGAARELTVVRGCLSSLVNSGLVSETEPGKFIRVKVRGKTIHLSDLRDEFKPVTQKEPEVANEKPVVTAPIAPLAFPSTGRVEGQSPTDKLAWLAARVATMGSQLKELAADIENATLDVEEALVAKDAQMAKYKQLKALLTEMT
jgi:hypothetical protein